MLASGVKLSKLNTNDLNSAGLVCLHCYSRACNACSNQCARLEKYVVLLCRSPNRYLYSADWFSQCAILYIKKKKRHKYIYNSEFSGRVSLIIWSRVGLEKCLLMLRVFLYQRRGMKYLLVLLEFLIVYVGGYPGVFLKSCSLSSSGDETCILVARDRCWFFYVSHAVPQCCCTALLHGCWGRQVLRGLAAQAGLPSTVLVL